MIKDITEKNNNVTIGAKEVEVLRENFPACFHADGSFDIERFKEYFAHCSNIAFEIVDSMEALVADADVLVSCITDAQDLLVNDISLFKPGILLVPVHTRGFQNCDLFFDKVFADDTDHVKGFRYFNQFKKFGEIGDVLISRIKGRENDNERILSYNIGLGLHDVYFSYHIYNLLEESKL